MEQSYSACDVKRAPLVFFLKIAMNLKSRGNNRMNVPEVSRLHRISNLISLASNHGILVKGVTVSDSKLYILE
jgi:hypothetical protein